MLNLEFSLRKLNVELSLSYNFSYKLSNNFYTVIKKRLSSNTIFNYFVWVALATEYECWHNRFIKYAL